MCATPVGFLTASCAFFSGTSGCSILNGWIGCFGGCRTICRICLPLKWTTYAGLIGGRSFSCFGKPTPFCRSRAGLTFWNKCCVCSGGFGNGCCSRSNGCANGGGRRCFWFCRRFIWRSRGLNRRSNGRGSFSGGTPLSSGGGGRFCFLASGLPIRWAFRCFI